MFEPEFMEFPKIPRLSRDIVITEKIDGTNGVICIDATGEIMKVGSRNRWLCFVEDNFGFYKWCTANRDELLKLGPGRHYGEWWGNGIQRGYGLAKDDKRFSLFNVHKWTDPAVRPACCGVVPTLYQGPFNTYVIEDVLNDLKKDGSKIAPFMNPEGIIIYHTAAHQYFKKTIEGDERPKGAVA